MDADRRVQQSLTDLLGVTGTVSVVGQAHDVRDALQLAERLRPDVMLIDPRLPDVEAGMALVTGLERAWPNMKIVLTGWTDVEGHASSLTPRFISKSSSPEAFLADVVAACCSLA